ncbi:hypothetical protein [Ideonella sp. BN130291]|uniref:hypothetical protein n=1 Tax=Ideonella sp. BN130291 TaxID=3112940 RepID=UPI002E269AC5|nr:hypothetical protein [Ideonella sp. BN130291]
MKPLPTSAADFAGWPCDAIADEIERVQQKAADVAYAVDANVANNMIVLTLGTTVFWPALLAMRPDGPDAEALARLKGRYEALSAAAAQRACPPMSDALPPARAAALPVALGERLVYEERAASGGPATELGLRLQALKRGELNFQLDHGPATRALPWRQDPAGNALAPQPYRVLSWTRLLHRDLQLGDVLSGELHGPDTAERTARVRGQVIAVGPTVVSGRQFDGATIELFGDVPNGVASTRVDGVMVVDRHSGVLLRLELRSGNPEYALRRKLVRIETPG